MNAKKILLIEDDSPQLKLVLRQLADKGYEAEGCLSAKEALERYKKNSFDLVITDFKMPDMSGIDVLCEIKRLDPNALVIFMTGYGTIDVAVSAMKKGAFDFLTKPYSLEVLLYTVDRAFRVKSLEEETIRLHMELMDRFCFENIVGGSRPMKELFKQIANASMSDSPCLVEGETGTGKELIARAMHYEGLRRTKPFVAVSCNAIPESLFEIELFGMEKGAVEGTARKYVGKLEQANEGSLFLDEVGELEPASQIKFLDFLQKKEFQRVGGKSPVKGDVRVIAASSIPLENLVQEKKFRKDLFSHLGLLRIHIPPLRDRKDDIPLLVHHFFAMYGLPNMRVDHEVIDVFSKYDWHGNIRELKNIVERMIILSPRAKALHVEDIPLDIRTILKATA
jgi:DNA-binding NtrC family response regulator